MNAFDYKPNGEFLRNFKDVENKGHSKQNDPYTQYQSQKLANYSSNNQVENNQISMIREQEIRDFKDAGNDDMVRHRVKHYDDTPGQTDNKIYDINTPGETSQE